MIMVNLSFTDKNVYKSLGFVNKSREVIFIKDVLKTNVTKYKTAAQLVQPLNQIP